MSVPLRFSSHLKIVPSPPMFCLCGAKGINISGLYLCSLQISPNKTLFETHLKDHERGSMSSMPTFSPNPSSQHSMSIFCGSNKIILCSFLLQNIQTIIECLLCPSLLKHLLECTMFVPFEASKWRYLVYFSFSAANAYKISLVWWSNLITFPSKPWRSRSCLFFPALSTLSPPVFKTTDGMYDFCFTRLCSKQPSEQASLFSLKATQESPTFSFLLDCSELYKESLALFPNQPCFTPVD